jgi:hypothetical protein
VSAEVVHEKAGPNLIGRRCQCHSCHKVGLCAPENDYYSSHLDKEGWLYCEACFLKLHGHAILIHVEAP